MEHRQGGGKSVVGTFLLTPSPILNYPTGAWYFHPSPIIQQFPLFFNFFYQTTSKPMEVFGRKRACLLQNIMYRVECPKFGQPASSFAKC